MNVKRWYESKMIWLGALEVVTAVITESADITATWQSIALAGLGAATILLRSITSSSVS